MVIPGTDQPGSGPLGRPFGPFLYASLAASCMLTGCGGTAARQAVIVSDSAGVTIVDNDEPHRPWTQETAWRLSETPAVQVGHVPGDPDHQLYRVRHALRLRNGSIAVANAGLGDVRLFDSAGVYLRALTLPRDEESEPIRPLRLHELPGDSLLVVLADHSLAVFDSTGSMARRSEPLSPDPASDPPPVLAGIFGNGTLLFRTYPPEDTTGTGLARTHVRLLTYSPAGEPLGSMGEFEHLTVLRGPGVYVFGAEGVEAAGDSTLWYGPGDRFELREVGLDGSTRRIVRLNRQPGDVVQVDTMAYRHSAIGELADTMGDESAAEAIVAEYKYAETFPSYAEIVVDDAGNLWVRAYQWFGLGQPQRWTVFDREGRFLGDLTMHALMQVQHIGEDFVLGRMANERGVEAVYLYRLLKPSAPTGGA
ncbi:MAG: hypothetical protein Q8N53_20535 [Longimicrobiales bacterium]|nr:hypothetical protein [Longimicrobiales bacterium]